MDRQPVRQRLYEQLGAISCVIPFLEEADVEAANEGRRALYERLTNGLEDAFHGSKPHYGPLSPGCQACGEGTWSCLFLNHHCNADCFWCLRDPAIHTDPPPTAHGLDFPKLEAYTEFLLRAGYNAVGISGGEPFLRFELLHRAVSLVREALGGDAWLWVYTNGRMVTEERVESLMAAGLDELRFDIAAFDYDLDALRKAAQPGLRLTVEIPAVPEDEEKLALILDELTHIGVHHLHLHQLTANAHNIRRFLGRPYTFLHQPALTVLESETTALRIMDLARKRGLPLAVQYCSKPYKQAAQGRSRRLRAMTYAPLEAESCTSLTATGFCRELITHEPQGSVGFIERAFPGADLAPMGSSRGGEVLYRVPTQLFLAHHPFDLPLHLRYSEPCLSDLKTPQAVGTTPVPNGVGTQLRPVGEVRELTREERDALAALFLTEQNPERPTHGGLPQRMRRWEELAGEEEVF